jgi:DNA-binding HxlR family transcriptional regulator
MRNNPKKADTGLTVINPHFITYTDAILTVDVLGGVDLHQIERMLCTIRMSYQNYPPYRTTLDLYSDTQTDQLIRRLCDKWELKMVDVSRCLHTLVLELETYRLEHLKFSGKKMQPSFVMSGAERIDTLKLLKSTSLLSEVITRLNTMGIIGENDNASILFMALASHTYSNPFSVLCLVKSTLDKGYLLQKLMDCMPYGSYSYHNRISANALYYFDSSTIRNKALIIEDLEWSKEMLIPFATLQNQGRLINTRTTKDRNGMLHSTTFEVVGRLCLLACVSAHKNYEHLGLPFLILYSSHSPSQDMALMDYNRQMSANLLDHTEIQKARHELKCIMATLENVAIVNPYATLIVLPETISNPRQSLSLLLHFIEIITYLFQYQRHRYVDEGTGETVVITAPDDIALAYSLLRDSLFRKADELASTTRGFYKWLIQYLKETEAITFTALAIRKEKAIHPRTLNRYLQELKLYDYLKIVGGNKHRGGYEYALTELSEKQDTAGCIERELKENLKAIRKYAKEQTHITQ